MEYVAGGELYDYVKSKGGASELEVRNIFVQLVDTIEYCHNKYIIHRDLKPSNILISDSSTQCIKLIDFGISGSNYGKEKSTAGSLAYMPPEVLTVKSTVADPAIDIWAMGIILYFMLYEHLPFKGPTLKDVYNAIIKSKVVFPSNKKVTEECKRLIQGMLNKNPKVRLKINEILQSDWLKLPDEQLIPKEDKLPPIIIKEEKKVIYKNINTRARTLSFCTHNKDTSLHLRRMITNVYRGKVSTRHKSMMETNKLRSTKLTPILAPNKTIGRIKLN
jgi:serine/threonine protein kinase